MTGRTDKLKNLVKYFVFEEELIPFQGILLAAVSGGQDSMAMLDILLELSYELDFHIHAAHFNHKLRKDSQRDRQISEEFCRKMLVPFHYGEADVLEQARKSGDTIEEAARKLRYDFLCKTADKIKANRIATGHTRDDQVETVLLRILWGSGIRGLAGIPISRGKIIRPIIHLRREDTHSYCLDRGIPFVTDPSNTDKRFMRNKIRHELLPFLKKSFHPGVEENILNLCSNAKTLIASIRNKTRPALEEALKKPSSSEWVLKLKKLQALDDTSLFVLLSDLFADYMQCDMDYSRKHYNELFKLCRSPESSGKSLSLPGITVRREFDELLLIRNIRPKEKEAIDLSKLRTVNIGIRVPGTTNKRGIRISAEVLERSDVKEGISSTEEKAFFAMEKITPPITLRTPEPGDRMHPFGMKGSKKISDIFIDKKIPLRRRARSFVISDAREIMWLVGVATSEGYRITDQTKNVLKLTVTRE